MPGLLQTEAYARATFLGQPLTDEEVTDLVTARLDRQGILDRRRGPLFVAVLDEQVLRRAAAGDRALMAAQVAHLVASAELPNVQLHVVPADTPTYPGLDGAFVIAELRDGTRGGTCGQSGAGADHRAALGNCYLERRWERIRGEALPRARTLELLREVAAAWT
ncbi:DUF5753 domain-containing protein [Micromonospora humi]|uniref:DUF5753 domain-containing protein n=1 Tax=Micromonospora humi TaxID=745366 RepID=A0A1C5K8R8_9ACTN|nr:hypothetical protein GA0070213_12314 [Micromonospora humi]